MIIKDLVFDLYPPFSKKITKKPPQAVAFNKLFSD